MRKAKIFMNGILAGMLEELAGNKYRFTYQLEYQGPPISLTMPLKNSAYYFNEFPSFFEGLLPEGIYLETLLRKYKLDKQDFFGQLVQVGQDLVGAITVEIIE